MHPLCNDNISGIVIITLLGALLFRERVEFRLYVDIDSIVPS